MCAPCGDGPKWLQLVEVRNSMTAMRPFFAPQYAAAAASAADAKRALAKLRAEERARDLGDLAAADAHFTQAWRATGLPSKRLTASPRAASMLADCGLLDTRVIMQGCIDKRQHESLPPKLFPKRFDGDPDVPHHLMGTESLKARIRPTAAAPCCMNMLAYIAAWFSYDHACVSPLN